MKIRIFTCIAVLLLAGSVFFALAAGAVKTVPAAFVFEVKSA